MAQTMLSSQARGKIDIIQLLRGIAALMVVLFHARTYVSARGPDDFLTWITNPFSTGIDLFFVISGFVMVYTTQSERSRRPQDFFVKRLCRIVPAYVIATIIYVLCMRVMEHFTGYRGMYDHLTPRDVLKSIAFIPVNLTDPNEPPFFGGSSLHVGWTLNYEAYFYLVFFGSLFFKRFRWLAFGGWMLFILVALPLIFRGAVSLDIRHFYGWSLSYLNLMTSCLIWEFIMGVIIGHLYLHGLTFPNVKSAWLTTCLVITLVAWAFWNGVAPKFGQLGYGAFYSVMICVLLAANNTVRFRIPAALIWLGDISFSLYLIHPTVIENLGIPLLQFEGLKPALTGFPYVIFLTVLSVCVAYPFHVLVERRLSNFLRDKLISFVHKAPPAQGGTNDLRPSH